jgi:hypothetical protein
MFSLRLRRLLVTGVSASLLALAAAQSAFADPRDFTLNNSSSVDIAQVYVSPTATDDWGDDILGTQVLPSGQAASVTFNNADQQTCNFDIKVLGVGGQEGYLYKVNLCQVTDVTFS